MNPADVLKYGHHTFTTAFESIPQADWETGGVCGVWSVRDIIAHLASYEHLLEEILAPFAGVTMPTPTMERMASNYQDFNDLEVAARAGKSLAEIVAEYNDTATRTMTELVPKIPPEKWREVGTIPWYGMEYSLDDYITYANYGHKREHAAQMNVFGDTLK